MRHYYGIVEDRQDPLKIGRVRVRVHGIHSDDKGNIATPDLPWAQVMLPTTSAGLSGFGTQHGLVEGSSVVLFFKDEELQQPVVIGSTAGIPQSGYKEDPRGELISRRVEKKTRGFNDPRELTTDAYEGTPDGKNPEHSPTRGFGLTTALDTAPKIYEERYITYLGKSASTIKEPELTEKDLPYYPLYTDQSDLSKLADTTDEKGLHAGRDILKKDGVLFLSGLDEIKSPAKPVYPYNKVVQSESGHVLEMDDTPSAERIAIEHRSGTFQEIHPDGSQVTRVVNDNYTIICKNEEVHIGGKVNIKVLGDANIHAGGNVDIKGSNVKVNASTGDLNLESGGNIILNGGTGVVVKSPHFSPDGILPSE